MKRCCIFITNSVSYKYQKSKRILDACTLSEINKQILRMYYIQEKDFGYIADELGFSIDTVKQRHRKSLKKISNVI